MSQLTVASVLELIQAEAPRSEHLHFELSEVNWENRSNLPVSFKSQKETFQNLFQKSMYMYSIDL